MAEKKGKQKQILKQKFAEKILSSKIVLHYPQLDTVIMVEEFMRKNSGEYKKRSLWEHLPKKMMYQTFCVIFDYLFYSGKIALDKEKKVAWVWDPEGVKRYLSRVDLEWKSKQT